MNSKSRSARFALIAAAAAAMICGVATESRAALAVATGGSGTSGKLSSNKTVRQQQLICDPATSSGGETYLTGGSLSVTYDPSLVTIADNSFNTGFDGSIMVGVTFSPSAPPTLESLDQLQAQQAYGETPAETGYLQYQFNANSSAVPGTFPVASGFSTYSAAGAPGIDTNALTFTYLPSTPDSAVAKYTIFAAAPDYEAGNSADFLSGSGPSGSFTVPFSSVLPATVAASLNGPAVPLPPAVWSALAAMGAIGLVGALRKRKPA